VRWNQMTHNHKSTRKSPSFALFELVPFHLIAHVLTPSTYTTFMQVLMHVRENLHKVCILYSVANVFRIYCNMTKRSCLLYFSCISTSA